MPAPAAGGYLQVVPAAVQGERYDGFRRFAVADEYPVPRFPRGAGEVPAEVLLYSSGRVPGHELFAVSDYQETIGVAPEPVRGGGRCAEHLFVPGGAHREYPEFQERLSRLQAVQAGAELPLDDDDCGGGELHHQQEPGADSEAYVLGKRGGGKNQGAAGAVGQGGGVSGGTGDFPSVTIRAAGLQ